MKKKTLCLHDGTGDLIQSRTVEDGWDSLAKHKEEMFNLSSAFGFPEGRVRECAGYGKGNCFCSSPKHIYDHEALKGAILQARELLNNCGVITVRMLEGRITPEQFEGLDQNLREAMDAIAEARNHMPMKYIFAVYGDDTGHMSKAAYREQFNQEPTA